jgi:hypothetical protein
MKRTVDGRDNFGMTIRLLCRCKLIDRAARSRPQSALTDSDPYVLFSHLSTRKGLRGQSANVSARRTLGYIAGALAMAWITVDL